ncbi:MAG TPA: PEGA domain-containing protein, partial [Enhygromyxa sp.]|nr:PEGA domain-containing protein [Enhygromyxa sp.]
SRSRLASGLACVALWLACSTVVVSNLGCVHTTGREPPASVLEIATATTDADVWVDGEYIGQVAAVSGKLRLAPGVHRVEIRKPGHFPVQRTVRVGKDGGGTVVVEAELLSDPR